jgi:hypothetical protein
MNAGNTNTRADEERGRRWLVVAAAVAVAFLVGAAWQYGRAERLAGQNVDLRRDLAARRAESLLQGALLETRADSTERARQKASAFFTTVQRELIPVAPQWTESLRQILADRDSVITALARSDTASDRILGDLLERYRQITEPAALVADSTS